MKKWKIFVGAVLLGMLCAFQGLAQEQACRIPEGGLIYARLENQTLTAWDASGNALGEPVRLAPGQAIAGQGKTLYLSADQAVVMGAECRYDAIYLIGTAQGASFQFEGKAASLYQYGCPVTIQQRAEVGAFHKLEESPLQAEPDSAGGEEPLVCGIQGHDYQNHPEDHLAASCGIIQGVNTRTPTHFVCDGKAHSPTLCARCGKEGHAIGDGKTHGMLGCQKHYGCDSKKLDHSKSECYQLFGHYNCDGKNHRYVALCGHFACDPRHGKDCVQATPEPPSVPMCSRCGLPLADHAICPACGQRLCQDEVASHQD